MQQTSYRLLALVLCFLTAAATAQEKQGPITVEADQLELNQQSGVSLYRGNVEMHYKGMLLRADRLELHSLKGRVKEAYATGTPVHLERKNAASGTLSRAEALQMEYRFDDGVLELKEEAHLWRDGDEFSGKHLIYDTTKQLVKAFGNKQSEDNGRVRVILQPEKDSANE